MSKVHTAQAEGVSYSYHEPQGRDGGLVKGIMYQKADSKTGEMKLKSADGFLERLLIKARGYSKLKESNAKKFLQAILSTTSLPPDIELTSRIKSFGGSKSVIKADVFQYNFKNFMATDKMVMNIKSMMRQ
ncbi:MAG: hypothetical protein ACKOAO_09010 [Oxalobacteraceae bacterium]